MLPAPDDDRPPGVGGVGRAARVLLHIVLLAAGFAVGVLGSFVHAATLVGAPVGLLCAYALTAAVIVVSRLVTGARSGAAAAAAGWMGALLLLSAPRPEGDLVVAGDLLGYAWLVGGLVVATLAVAVPSAPLGSRR